MTKTTMHMTLASHGAEFRLGPGEEADITAVTGLESSEYDIGLSDLAAVPGSSLDGIHVKARPIHIEGSFRSSGDTEADREKLIRFFMPDRDGVLTVRVGKRTRSIGYNVEGWTLKARRNLDVRVGFIIDLICPDPYFTSGEPIVVEFDETTKMVYNNGDADTGFVATLELPDNVSALQVDKPFVVNGMGADQLGADKIGITGFLHGADYKTLEISTEPRSRTIMINGRSEFSQIDRASVPFLIPVGGCFVTYGAESNANLLKVKLTYRERFLGV